MTSLLPNGRDILKPYGTFIEYTVKPLIDDGRELLELIEKQGLPAKDITRMAVKMYIFNMTINFLQAILVTGMICLTCLHLLK